MDKDKSILEKITDTVKDIANVAADAAGHAMKAEQAPVKVAERSAAYIPLAADGLVSDPMMVPPIAAAPSRKRKRAASRRAARASKKTNPKRLSKNPRRRQRGKLRPGGQGVLPKRPRGKPAGKRQRGRARQIPEVRIEGLERVITIGSTSRNHD